MHREAIKRKAVFTDFRPFKALVLGSSPSALTIKSIIYSDQSPRDTDRRAPMQHSERIRQDCGELKCPVCPSRIPAPLHSRNRRIPCA